MAQLDGKIVVITGSGRGQGLAAARLFAADVAPWLASDASSFVNGQDIVVDGGASIYTALIAGRGPR